MKSAVFLDTARLMQLVSLICLTVNNNLVVLMQLVLLLPLTLSFNPVLYPVTVIRSCCHCFILLCTFMLLYIRLHPYAVGVTASSYCVLSCCYISAYSHTQLVSLLHLIVYFYVVIYPLTSIRSWCHCIIFWCTLMLVYILYSHTQLFNCYLLLCTLILQYFHTDYRLRKK